MLEGATSGLGSPTVRSTHGPLMHPILRLSIPCRHRASVRCFRAGPSSTATCPWRPSILWRALPRRGTHQHGLRGIHGQSGDREALLYTPAGAVDPTQGASPIIDPNARVTCRLGGDIPGVASRVPCLPPANGGIPPRIKRSPVQTESGDAPPTGGDERGSGVGASPRTWVVWG